MKFMFRFIIAIVSTFYLMGCAAQPPEGSSQVNLVSYRAELKQQFPKAKGFNLSSKNFDFAVADNGKSVFRPKSATSGLVTVSTVEKFDKDQLCFAKSGGWSGVCISLARSPSQALLCNIRFGNGSKKVVPCVVEPIFGRDA
ncbi:hypothetical protein N9M66_00285 [Litoreibacter sp.]|nr:hypothetical protein [Litoreibacter sp.]